MVLNRKGVNIVGGAGKSPKICSVEGGWNKGGSWKIAKHVIGWGLFLIKNLYLT